MDKVRVCIGVVTLISLTLACVIGKELITKTRQILENDPETGEDL